MYTIWREDEFIYVGMSGQGAQREDFVANDHRPLGLWTRLNSHASGRRSGDQFNVYICDRFIIPNLDRQEQQLIGRGTLMLDQLTRAFIREQLGFRLVVCQGGDQALALKREVRAGSLPAGRPYLNPL